MDRPEDYARLGINPHAVEVWEDRRRGEDRPEVWEWWSFDAILDDGTKLVIQFLTTKQKGMTEREPTPNINIKVTRADGTTFDAQPEYTAEQAGYGTDQCDVTFGPNAFKGDLRDYTIRLDQSTGVGADLHLINLGTSYRPGTAYFGFGDDDENYYTWLCVIPRGEVTGTLTIDGETVEIHGYGYHDHQWGNMNFWLAWNNWLWARQSFEDYSILVFDMIAGRDYGFERFPIAFVQDKDGNLIFENTHQVAYAVLEEYTDPKSGKDYPRVSRYTFNQYGKMIEYKLAADQEIDVADVYKAAPEPARAAFDRLGLHPSYTRYSATGDLIITEGATSIERTGQLIYEFMYPGASPYCNHV
jgi:predicted secreted hydrolase